MSRELEQVKRVQAKMFPGPVLKPPVRAGEMVADWDVLPDEAVEAVAHNLMGMYRTYPVEMAQKVILAALPQLLLEAWDSGFLSVSENLTNRTVRTKAVEPAAEAIYSFCGNGWNYLSSIERMGFRADAELALEVAIQYLPVLTEVFNNGANAAADIHKLCQAVTNPYRELQGK